MSDLSVWPCERLEKARSRTVNARDNFFGIIVTFREYFLDRWRMSISKVCGTTKDDVESRKIAQVLNRVRISDVAIFSLVTAAT